MLLSKKNYPNNVQTIFVSKHNQWKRPSVSLKLWSLILTNFWTNFLYLIDKM